MTNVKSSEYLEKDQFYPYSEKCFIAQDSKPNSLIDVDFASLSPVQRSLLVIDGTVTRFLEAYAFEPIVIANIDQTNEVLSDDHPFLDLPKGTEVVSRRVQLKGRRTNHVYAVASSLVDPIRVKEALADKMDHMSKGLGRMLLSGRVEQYRELLWCGRVPHDETADRSCALSTAGCLTRTYRVMIKGKPTMMITEWFEPGGSLAGS